MPPRGQTVLVVDDEPHVVHVVRFKLEQAGLNVITASNGIFAYELACRHAPDLVVTDFQMPGGDGFELARRLSENDETKAIPLIMLTARGHRAPVQELARTNVRALLAKPFSPRDLLRRVHELLGAAGGADAGASAA